jgi:hypothetical protein
MKLNNFRARSTLVFQLQYFLQHFPLNILTNFMKIHMLQNFPFFETLYCILVILLKCPFHMVSFEFILLLAILVSFPLD